MFVIRFIATLLCCHLPTVLSANLTATNQAVTTNQVQSVNTRLLTTTSTPSYHSQVATSQTTTKSMPGYCEKPLPANHVECDNGDFSQIQCLEKRARLNLSYNNSDVWVIHCTFHSKTSIGDEILNKDSYSCTLPPELGHVRCEGFGVHESFEAECRFTMFHCMITDDGNDFCGGKFAQLFEDGGECGATDKWCPDPSLYSINKYIPKPNSTFKFGGLEQFTFKAPSHCMTNEKIIALVVGGVVAIIVIIAFVVLFKRMRPMYKKHCDPKRFESSSVVRHVAKLLTDDTESSLTAIHYRASEETEHEPLNTSSPPPPSDAIAPLVNGEPLSPPAVSVRSSTGYWSSNGYPGRSRLYSGMSTDVDSVASTSAHFLSRPLLPHEPPGENLYQDGLNPTPTAAHFKMVVEKCEDSSGDGSGNPRSLGNRPSTSSQSSFVNPGYLGFNNYTVFQQTQAESGSGATSSGDIATSGGSMATSSGSGGVATSSGLMVPSSGGLATSSGGLATSGISNHDDEVFHADGATSGGSTAVNLDNPSYL